ncbi:MAG: ATP-binding protein [Desulfobacterales bacterium]|jgi:PAS domain S-box-containing protein
MKPSRISIAIFNSRIGKRIFWMFVCCSFLPIMVLSALSYNQVKRQLNDQTVVRLRQMTKAIGMSIYERLELIESEMRLLAPTMAEMNPETWATIDLSQKGNREQRFQGLVYISDDGRRIPLYGRVEGLIPFSAAEKTSLHAGRSIILTGLGDDAPYRIALSIKTAMGDTTGVLVGEVNPTYLWGIGQQYNLPPLTELTIIDSSGRTLISSLPPSEDLVRQSASPQRDRSTHHFTWHTDDKVYLASYWDLFLKSRFTAERWTIVLSQTREDALAVMRSFKFDFPLALLVGFWVILLLSIRFIRKSMVPLERLQEGTRRIHDGDFSQPVSVDSGDEFEDLATSFNMMTRRLARTFAELSVMAELGHFVTTRPEVVDLVTTELRIMAAKLDFDWGLLMIDGAVLSGENVIAGYGIMNQDEPRRPVITRLDDHPSMTRMMTDVASHNTLVFSQDTSELITVLPTPFLDFLDQLGCQSLLCVPLSFETVHMGILAVGKNDKAQPLTESDQHLVVSIAAQTAIAINNIISFHMLEDSEARFRQAFDHAATGIALVTPDRKIRASNRYLQVLLGYTEEALLGRSLGDITVAAEHANGQQTLSRLIAGEQTFTQFEEGFRHKDGHTVWTRINGSLMRDKQGTPLYFIFHIQDLSAEKAAEQDKHQLEIQLRQAQKMEAIGTLAGGIAHDFNNILSAVGGYTELAMLHLPEDSAVRTHLQKVNTATERATDLVRQILAFSRQSEHERIPLQISSVVKEALQLLRASLPATIEIRKSIDNGPLSVLADPTQIHQIVMNLCTNALHAMQDTGGVLEIGLKKVDLSREKNTPENRIEPGPYVNLTISDTGCGMDVRTLDRIFDPYFTTKEKGKGTGLGLAVVHGIVESHGGTIDVSSTPGKGTTFSIYFPVAEQQAQGLEKPLTDNPVGTERVLFIDDEPMLVDVCKTMLEKLGYQVTGMTDPQAALEAFRQNPQQFDIVITDLTMPGITGDRLAEKMAALRPEVPILLCSGYLKRIGPHTALSGTIRKPITIEKLARALREALDP